MKRLNTLYKQDLFSHIFKEDEEAMLDVERANDRIEGFVIERD